MSTIRISRTALGAALLTLAVSNPTQAQVFVMDNGVTTTCSGIFTDSGGLSGQHGNDEALVKTFQPGVPGGKVAVDFTDWDLARGLFGILCQVDTLEVFDGPTTDPASSVAFFCYATEPSASIVSTAPGGELTFQWTSNSSGQGDGWSAFITCIVGSPDECSGAEFLEATNVASLFGTPPDGSASCDPIGGSDCWYRMIPASTGTLSLDTLGSSIDTVVSVHSGCPGTPLNELACSDDAIGFTSAVLATVTAGSEVFVRVAADGDPTSTGSFTLNSSFQGGLDCFTAPEVDAGALGTLNAGETYTADLPGFGPLGSTSCDPVGGSARWWTFISPGDGNLVIDTFGSTVDTVLSVHSACTGTIANELACSDDYGGGQTSSLGVPLLIGQQVWIRVAEKGDPGSVEEVTLNVDFSFGDDCANAVDIDALLGPGYFAAGLVPVRFGGTPPDGSSSCDCAQGGTDHWYEMTATVPGTFVVATNESIPTDVAVSLHSSCPGTTSNELACDDTGIDGFTSYLTRAMVPGETVLVRVAAECDPASTEDFRIQFEFVDGVPPANDDCANATALPPTYQIVSWTTTLATTDGSDATGFCDYGESGDEMNWDDVWFTWTAPATECVYISHFGLMGINTRLTVYDDTTCPDNPARIVACADDEELPRQLPFEAGLDFQATAGTTYLIRCGTFLPGPINVDGQMRIAAGPGAELNHAPGTSNPGAPDCGTTFTETCTGDGGDGLGCTPCPCGNDSPPSPTAGGCLNSNGTGARLVASGSESVTAPHPGDLRFEMSGATPISFAVLVSGNAIAPTNAANPCFAQNPGSGVQSVLLDGLRCAVQSVLRHGSRGVDANGDVGVTTGGWGGASGPTAGLAGQAGFTAGQTRHFQSYYRELPDVLCMTGQNTSQAVTVSFIP